MARGFLTGAVWGGVLSIGVAGLASVLSPLPAPPPQASPPQVSDLAPEEVAQPQPSQAVEMPDVAADVPPQQMPTAQQTEPSDADTLGTLTQPQTALAPVSQPDVVAALNAPDALPDAGGVALADEEPVFPNPQALAPMLPQEADPVQIDTRPAALPTVVENEPADPSQEGTPPDAATTLTEDTGSAVDEAPTPETAPLAPPQVAEAAPEPVDPPATTAIVPDPPEVAEPEPEAPPQVAMLAPSARPQIGTPATSLTDRSNGVTVNRLTGDNAEPETPRVTVITDNGATAVPGNAPPLQRNAEPFANPDNKPLMAVVLIDDGSTPTAGAAGIAALRSFPYTLNIAVDSALPDAAERMALYRTAGFEVLAMVDLPEGAQPLDVETTFGATLSQMREVVGVLEGPAGGLQPSRDVADQVTAVLAQSGHGLVTQDKGLNTMPKLARKEGVPADPIFRDFDSKGQTAQVIRRFLDQAAFKAGQEGAVIMLGRMRPDTISALLLWGLQDRAGQVALAPISALLTREGA